MIPFNIPQNATFALGAALLWGGGDFTGGIAVRRAGGSLQSALIVVLISHTASFTTLIALAHLLHAPMPHGATLAWGLAAGCVGGLAILLFYLALARGAMGAAAAVSGLLASAIPAAVSTYIEGSPGWLHLLGFATAAAAIWLIANGGDRLQPVHQTTALAIASGAGFGLYFVCLKFAAPSGLVWAMASARMVSLTLCSLMLLAVTLRAANHSEPAAHHLAPRIGHQVVLWAVGSASMDTSGNMLFMASTRAGRLDVASVLSSLYPASTILLAAWMLRESPTRRQTLGMAIALAAVLLIAS